MPALNLLQQRLPVSHGFTRQYDLHTVAWPHSYELAKTTITTTTETQW